MSKDGRVNPHVPNAAGYVPFCPCEPCRDAMATELGMVKGGNRSSDATHDWERLCRAHGPDETCSWCHPDAIAARQQTNEAPPDTASDEEIARRILISLEHYPQLSFENLPTSDVRTLSEAIAAVRLSERSRMQRVDNPTRVASPARPVQPKWLARRRPSFRSACIALQTQRSSKP